MMTQLTPQNNFSFELLKESKDSRARAGIMQTAHGPVETPIFMPVGTFGSVKTLSAFDMKELGAQIILGNTFHLLLRPGPEAFEKFGGIHGFIKWDRPTLTDSGGFQLFCLPNRRKISEDGAMVRSYVDGKYIMLSPEVSIAMQQSMNTDIMMVLDECVPSTAPQKEILRAMALTHRWALRSLNARTKPHQALFAIIQGGLHLDLRKQSAEFLCQHNFDGFAVGGLAVGESKQEREDVTEFVTALMPKHKPRYLMGVGTPLDLLEAVYRGIDMFDCIIPTMYAQQGVVFTTKGKMGVFRKRYALSDIALDENCSCHTCQNYSLGYLNHLTKCQEPLGWRLLAIHNVHYYLRLMEQVRTAILEDRYEAFYKETKAQICVSDTGTVNG